jgi:hypothetical protein
MKTTLLLCDFAQVSEGKLTAVGIGWDKRPAGPLPCGIGLIIDVGWEETNVRHHVVLRLVDADGHPVRDEAGNALEPTMDMEVGRPPGHLAGASVRTVHALNLTWPFTPGRFQWTVEVDGVEQEEAAASFDVLAPMEMRAG